jgi:regulatory protein
MIDAGDSDATAQELSLKRRRRPEPTPLQRALGLLTRREHSQQELTRKLVQRGVEGAEAEAVVERLKDAGWQNDERFAESLMRNRAGSGYGPAYIRAELKTHGLSSGQVDTVMSTFEGDWQTSVHGLLQRRYPQALAGNMDVQRKAVDFLLRRGFPLELVRDVLRSSD